MDRIKFTYPLSGCDAACFAELDGEAEVFDDGDVEVWLYDHISRDYVEGPAYLRNLILPWLSAAYAAEISRAWDEAIAGRRAYDRELSAIDRERDYMLDRGDGR